MRARFTAGPWQVAGGLTIKATGATRRHITRVGADHLNADEDHANAHLIAAAPDLYEAGVKLQEWNDRENDGAIGFRDRVALCFEAFALLDAALAKARGEVGA